MKRSFDLAASAWMLDVLRSLQRWPAHYLGAENVRTLEAYLAGCLRGRNDSGRKDDDDSILHAFGEWLVSAGHVAGDRVPAAMGWTRLVEWLDPSSRNLHTFFRRFGEFLSSQELPPLVRPTSSFPEPPLSVPSQVELQTLLDQKDYASLQTAILGLAFYEEDLEFVERACLALLDLSMEHELVRGNAVLGLGHVARRFLTLSEASRDAIAACLRDPSEYVRGQAATAAEDARNFLGWAFAEVPMDQGGTKDFFVELVSIVMDARCTLPMRALVGDLIAAEARVEEWYLKHARPNLSADDLMDVRDRRRSVETKVREGLARFSAATRDELMKTLEEAARQLEMFRQDRG